MGHRWSPKICCFWGLYNDILGFTLEPPTYGNIHKGTIVGDGIGVAPEAAEFFGL